MSKIFLISDTHFGHENIIKYCDRPFKNANEMDWELVERWNSVVSPQDKVYHLGDVYMGCKKPYIEKILHSLNGKKRLVLGNHDNGRDQILQDYFQKISVWRLFSEYGLLLSHVPVHPSSLGEGRGNSGKYCSKWVNVHGHIHKRESPKGPYKCVCVEHIDYTPINIEELLD